MASLYTDANGTRTIQFRDHNGKRRTIRLGAMPKRDAEEIRKHVEKMVVSKVSRLSVENATATWLAVAGRDMLAKLAKVGLLELSQASADEEEPPATLGPFLESFVAQVGQVKPGTITVYQQSIGWLNEYFGKAKPLDKITAGDAVEFRNWLSRQVGSNTMKRHCGRAKQFFRHAQEKELIKKNPFAGMKKCAVDGNSERKYFITLEQSAAVLEACPDAQWRLLFALARFGGLRTPSEVLLLKLTDVDWEKGRIRVTSPKTEHHEGKGERFIPIFPELRPLLLEAAEAAPPGTQYVITKYRGTNCNLRTQFERILTRAGIAKWPKLFQNLRSSRQTELAQSYPHHVVCAWMGNSQVVAEKHYLQMRPDDFAAANEQPSALHALQTALQQGENIDAREGTTTPADGDENAETACIPSLATSCRDNQYDLMTPTGLEPVLPP
jgi:integrase